MSITCVPVGRLVGALVRLGCELFAGGLGDRVVAVEVTPADVDHTRERLERGTFLGLDCIECRHRPRDGPFHYGL